MLMIMIFKIIEVHERNILDNKMNDFNEFLII